ncbi:MAG: hypothetical protein US57_C0014G0023 [Candidatus Moranbacteria bacterium GW2011_GWC2_37_73]|nr:MAG: hypothetical protein UR95_C0002G0043 [Parcubacteria group bacterium GW2011_GWC1_36_108]KKP99905.1 MAG: hypothetical protein US09_C0029G0008 [Candidatus Moranbacteria bacterium GW2011_GWD1_36_198]KKQ00162.1 MAG: hypothetical protein US10_C0039G0002 [Candidatus Moranbacteria bacterium GW2011_GWD2_36_198]KKQ39400.1 MAG: hypothetical protein US57_C0014G0023 [Candidatus Moranbacteria bacterium GW2011_GWC2_37_73]HAS00063.1 hypothetical protein [Candidatus Moranbacteria bacterium]
MKNVSLVIIVLAAVVGLLAFAHAFGQVPLGNEEKIALDYLVMKICAIVAAISLLIILAADFSKKARELLKKVFG